MTTITVIWQMTALLTVALRTTSQASLPADPYYTAGVVEFRSSWALTSLQRLRDSLNGYLEVINSEEADPTDIIVFPESTLNGVDQATFVPNPAKSYVVPCDRTEPEQYEDFLVQLSCAAKMRSKYIVINLTEKEWCATVPEDTRPCAANGLNVFNTNVVFDRKGAVISRYRKVHLYGEGRNTTFVPEFGWFDTDFGVRFGHFICFDLLFYSPAQKMVVDHRLKDFLFPTMWFSQLPFLTAVQIHSAWSYANDVNFLAAGASNPLIGSTGTGIYNGRKGALVAVMNKGSGQRKLYVARVPKYNITHQRLAKRSFAIPTPPQSRGNAPPSILLKRDYLEGYVSALVDLKADSKLKRQMCFTNNTFCCNFDLSWHHLQAPPNTKYYTYRTGVYDGFRNERASETNYLKNCAIFACTGDDIEDCGKVYQFGHIEPQVAFDNITITADFPKRKEYLLMPNSLKDDLLPVSVKNFEWTEVLNGDLHSVRYTLNTTTANLLTFSIYGNYFDNDFGKQVNASNSGDSGSYSSMFMSTLEFLLVVLLNLFL